MMNISRHTRDEIENEFMSLVLHKNEVLDLIQIKPQYLHIKKNQIMLQQLLENWKINKLINYELIVKKHNDFDFNWWSFLYNDTFYYEEAYLEQLKLSEESIVKYYKEDIIKNINKRLEAKEISYDEFMKAMKKLDDIKIVNEANVLTNDELINNIAEQKQIKFNKYPKMGKILKLAQNDLLVIGSMTGTGKTGFMLNLMSDLMEDYQCIYFNMEMSKSSIYKRIIAINADIPVDSINYPTDFQREMIKQSINKISNSKVIMEHQVNNISQIRALVSKRKDKQRHTIIFIDHLGLTKIDGKQSLYEQMTEIMKELRKICLEYDCTIIGASQLNRSAYTSDELSLSMLKDSGELENSARKIILLYRDKGSPKESLEPTMNIDICKNDSGSTGVMQMKYFKVKQIFKEI